MKHTNKFTIVFTLIAAALIFAFCGTAQAGETGGGPPPTAPSQQTPSQPNGEAPYLARIADDKRLRYELSLHVDHLKNSDIRSAERTLALRALQQARHWLGEDLAIAGRPYPYPNGNNPESSIVDPPADVAGPTTSAQP